MLPCPDPELLRALHSGGPASDDVRAHVETCPTCAQALMRMAWESGTRPDTSPGETATLQEPATRLAIGSRIGRYVVVSELGSGGMGIVYAAHDPELDRRVAIKLLRSAATGTQHTSAAQAKLLSEAQAMAKLAHPNVVSVFDVGTHEDRVFVAMEYVDGQTLRQWLAAAPRREGEIREALLAAARGLAAAHAAGLIHRDFKPDNVLVGRDGRVRVMDFGIAEAADPDEETGLPEDAQRIAGTPAYLAPEQLTGAKASELSDQFSFGVTLFEALHGELPFRGHPLRRDPATRWEFEPVKEAAASPALRRIALRALSVDPAARFPGMAALIDVLAIDPVARRRGRMLGALAVAAVAAIVGGYQWQLSHSRQLCQGFEEKPAGLFDQARRTFLRSAFAATGKSYAEDSYQRTEKLLTEYATDWTAARTEACEATHLRGEQPPEVLSLRMVCLDRRLEEWSALIDLFARADGELVEQAVKATLALTPISRCADVAALQAPVPPPTDPEIVARVEALRAPLAEVKALLDAGRYEEAGRKSGPLVPLTKATGYAPIIAQALLFDGIAQSRNSRAEATATLREAFVQAIAARDDGSAVFAATQLLRDLWERGDFPQAEVWGQVGRALDGRMDTASRLHGTLLMQIAGMHWRRGDLDAAAKLLDQAWRDVEGHGEGDSLRGAILNAHALVLDQKGEGERSLEFSAQAAELQSRLYGPEHPETLKVQMNRTIALYGAGRAREAIELGEKTLEALQRTLGPNHLNTLGQMLSIGDALLLMGDAQRAHELARIGTEGHVKLMGPEHPRTGIAYNYLGGTLRALGRHQEAIAMHEHALKIVEEKVGRDSVVAAIALNGLANALLAGERPAQALPLFERALTIAEAQKLESIERPVAQLGVASALAALKKEPARTRELAGQALPRLERLGREQLAREARALLAER